VLRESNNYAKQYSGEVQSGHYLRGLLQECLMNKEKDGKVF